MMKQRLSWLAVAMFLIVFVTTQEVPLASAAAWGQLVRGTVDTHGKSGADLYREACSACHGPDGKGKEAEALGFDVPTPDFTDCQFAPREANADWVTVTHEGGPVRGFSKHMPAFGGAFSETDLYKVVDYVKTFCQAPEWPRGELNLPKPLFTEKAFPEDEWVWTTEVGRSPADIATRLVYEKRFGPRNQIEIALPFGAARSSGGWNAGIGDLAVGFKRALAHSLDNGYIVSLSGEVVLPTGHRSGGFSKGTTIFESFVTFGKLLPAESFFQFQGGVELPADRAQAGRAGFWRAALGRTFTEDGSFGRAWSPMVEILGGRVLERGAQVEWDIVPQFQVTLNTRQHIRFNVGWRTPLSDRRHRSSRFAFYFLWDWFDGGLRDGW